MIDRDYVVYTHNDSEGNVRYIGSGRLRRANTRNANSDRGLKYKEWVNIHGKLFVNIVKTGVTKEEALDIELELFTLYEIKGTLLNISKPSKTKKLPDISELKSTFYYDETSRSGLRWNRDGKSSKYGEVAGTLNNSGYYQVYLNKRHFLVHRIILALHEVSLGDLVVDHIDGNRTNNLLSNLRVVSQADNVRNRRIVKAGELPLGVRHSLKRGMIIATVTDSSRKTLSGFSTPVARHFLIEKYGYEEALRLAIQARKELLEYIENKNNITYSDSHKVIDNNSQL